jgi:hypothetical protein
MAPAPPAPTRPVPAVAPPAPPGGVAARVGTATGRSLLPLLALAILASTLAFGPWVSLVLAYGAWRLAGVYA